MKNNTLTLGSLFDGSGGFPLGGLLAGNMEQWCISADSLYDHVRDKVGRKCRF